MLSNICYEFVHGLKAPVSLRLKLGSPRLSYCKRELNQTRTKTDRISMETAREATLLL